VLTISRLSRWSINDYNDTVNQAQAAAMDRQAAGGGLGEYYSESDTRVPTWVVVGDATVVGELTGLDAGALQACPRLAHTNPPGAILLGPWWAATPLQTTTPEQGDQLEHLPGPVARTFFIGIEAERASLLVG
jgi:hypothetical protein